MHFFRPGTANHSHNLAAGGSAHDGIIDEHYAFPFEQTAHWIQLQLNPKVSDCLTRFDECASHVVAADKAEAQWNSAFLGVAYRGRHTGVRHGNHNVSFRRSLPRKLAAQIFAALLHWPSENTAIRTGKINMLKNATRLRHWCRIKSR